MTGVSDIGSQLSRQFMLRVLREQMTEAERQSASGKLSTTIAGLGGSGASRAISFRNQNNLLDGYTENLNLNKTRMEVMDKSILSITDSARDMMNKLRAQLQGTPPEATILANDAATYLKSVADKMNTQLDGRYLFGGDAIESVPVNNLAALNANIGAQVTAAIGDPLTTTASFITTARGVANSALGLNTDVVTAGNVTFRSSDNSNIDYTVKASGDGFQDILRGLAIVANLPQPTTAAEQANYWDMVNSAISLLDQGTTKVDQYQASLGYQARNVANLISEHSATHATIEEFIGDVEDLDMADAAVRFANLKTQMETSYSMIASLRDLSLVKYI
jgi:flagellar hook-associated protein 3 FlgL